MGKNTGKEIESGRLCYLGCSRKTSLSREQTPEWYLSKVLMKRGSKPCAMWRKSSIPERATSKCRGHDQRQGGTRGCSPGRGEMGTVIRNQIMARISDPTLNTAGTQG